MAKIIWSKGVDYQNLPATLPVRGYQENLYQGFKDLVLDCRNLATLDGGDLSDTFCAMGALLADFSNLLGLDRDQLDAVFGPEYAASLIRDGLVEPA